MNIHKNARLTPLGREHLVRSVLGGQTPQATAQAAGVCPRTVHKWVARFKAGGVPKAEWSARVQRSNIRSGCFP
jgi:transposase-like protein